MDKVTKPRQKPTTFLVSKTRDIFGVWEVNITIDGRPYTYPVSSEYAVRKAEKLIKQGRGGKAIHVLKLFLTTGFNQFKETTNGQGNY